MRDGGAGQPAQPFDGAAPLRNPRTQQEQQRVQAVIDAASQQAITGAWNTLTQNHTSLTYIPTPISAAQIELLIDAAVTLEGNRSKPVIGDPHDDQPPDVPLAMWKGLLTYLLGVESGGNVLAMAGVADEDSYGILQFHDQRAKGNNFTGGPQVPIYKPGKGLTEKWKDVLRAATTLAELHQAVATVGNDWRADPYMSLRNGIRSSQAYYGRLMTAPQGQTGFDDTKDFLVYAMPPEREHGEGSQRDVFELFAVAHRMQGDAFGVVESLEGGLWTDQDRLAPYQWHTEEGNAPTGLPWMTAAGRARATSARAFYTGNAPAGGYVE